MLFKLPRAAIRDRATARMRQLRRDRHDRTRATSCLACGEPVSVDGHAVMIRGDLFHAACVLYKRR